MTYDEVSYAILGKECLIKWKEEGEDLSLLLQCSGFSAIENYDYYIHFKNHQRWEYQEECLIKLSQIKSIFISKIFDGPVIVLKISKDEVEIVTDDEAVVQAREDRQSAEVIDT
jgi:hypothetical protein